MPGMSFGRGGPRVYVGFWGTLVMLPFIVAVYLVVAVVWVLAGAGMLLGTMIDAAVERRSRRRSAARSASGGS